MALKVPLERLRGLEAQNGWLKKLLASLLITEALRKALSREY